MHHSIQVPKNYGAATYKLPKDFVREITTLQPKKSDIAICETWTALIAIIWTLLYAVPDNYFWVAYVPAIFLIAGRFGALLQLVHEASHGLLSPSKDRNQALARWLCAYPVGVFYDGYVTGHKKHHTGTNTLADPPSDTEKYRVVDCRKPELYLLFLKDLLGITALNIFFKYKENEEAPNSDAGSKLKALVQITLVQLIVLSFIFHFNLVDYFLLWLFPAASTHMFLMRIRGMAEHGLAGQLGSKVEYGWEGTFYTRSFMTPQNRYKFLPFVWLERILIGSLNVNHHHEHHLFPTVPFYHLPKLHRRISREVAQNNPDVYALGYFAAAMRSLLGPDNAYLPTTVRRSA